MTITARKVKKKIILQEEDFSKLIKSAEKNENININFEDEFDELLEISTESIEFWKNEIDDKVWNNA